MTLPLNFIQARYTPSFGEYKDNPFIEALPPIMQEIADIKANLIGKVDFNPEDILRSKNERIHLSSQLLLMQNREQLMDSVLHPVLL